MSTPKNGRVRSALRVLAWHKRTPRDVLWVGTADGRFTCSWDAFAAMPKPPVRPDLVIAGDGWWLQRSGTGWIYVTPPVYLPDARPLAEAPNNENEVERTRNIPRTLDAAAGDDDLDEIVRDEPAEDERPRRRRRRGRPAWDSTPVSAPGLLRSFIAGAAGAILGGMAQDAIARAQDEATPAPPPRLEPGIVCGCGARNTYDPVSGRYPPCPRCGAVFT